MTDLHIYNILNTVFDPEIPVLSIVDLGLIRKVEWDESEKLHIHLSPTYMGCPAMDTISADIHKILNENEIRNFEIKLVLSPAWTTDWMSEEGKKKLNAYGIAPPLSPIADKKALSGEAHQVACPQCKSTNTYLLSAFGSTACKALFKCKDCLEPFDYFKCLR
jgi:ring-1,2-phenylacetyl-CoA epoxidase subunit PaaD